MDHHSKLVVLVLVLLSGGAHAGYAQLAPPSGYTGTAITGFKFTSVAANGDTWLGSTVRTNAALNVAGQAVKVPVTMRLAANAGRFAAAAAFGWPGVFLAAGVAAYSYFQGEGYQARSDGWYKARTLPGTYQMTSTFGHACTGTVLSEVMNCSVAGLTVQGDWVVGVGYSQEPVHWTGGSCETGSVMVEWQTVGNFVASELRCTLIGQPETTYDKLTRQQFESGLTSRPVPETLPEVWPPSVPVQWPVEAPVINPNPLGVPEPLRVPVGDPVPVPLPVPNPDNLPQTWRQPVVDIVPSPTPDQRWRVDVLPKDSLSSDPTPMPSPVSVPAPTSGSPGSPTTDTPPGLCDQYPNILACVVPSLGDVTPTEVPNENRAMAITKNDGWGPSNGSCPAPRTAVVMGQSISMPLTGICDFATAIRPIMIGLAWFSAALVFFGLGRKD